MPLTRVPAAGWLSDGNAMNAAMISSRVTSDEPITQQRLGLAEDVGAVLLLLGLGGRHGIADPFQPDPHAVVVDLLFVADQRAGGDTDALQPGHQRDVHHLAAGLQLHPLADDGVEILAHVGREHILAHPFAIDLLGELDQFIVGLDVGDGHGHAPFRLGHPRNEKPATRGGCFSDQSYGRV